MRFASAATVSLGTYTNSADLSTNFSMSHGQATRSTRGCSRVIHFIVSYPPGRNDGAPLGVKPDVAHRQRVQAIRSHPQVAHLLRAGFDADLREHGYEGCEIHETALGVLVRLSPVRAVERLSRSLFEQLVELRVGEVREVPDPDRR